MIFKNKFIKLPDGDNLSLYATGENTFNLFVSNGEIKKKRLTLGNIVRCENLKDEFACDYIEQISDEYLCLCFDGNISLLKNEEEHNID